MRKNHFHSAGNSKRAAALKHGYKSGLEHVVADAIKSTLYDLKYETEIIICIIKYIFNEKIRTFTYH